ncbi:MAG: FecR domain-containing protein [Mucilaginibacter sp.]
MIELFIKYLQDRCTPEELRLLFNYFDQPENETVLRNLIRAELEFEHQGEIVDSRESRALQKVKENILQQIRQPKKPTHHWLRIAAVWLVLLSPLAYFYFTTKVPPVTYRVARTAIGERRLLTLTDGTQIWLSPSSTLQYPDQLNGKFREVKLEGEAFFEVAKDKAHPFIIHSGRMDTRVVGTSFTIQARPDQSVAEVTVVTGIVRVSTPGHQVLLRPDQQSRWDRKSGLLTPSSYPTARQMLKRKDGILTYDGAPVREVLADLARYYRRPVILGSASRNCLCYGEFDTNRPVAIVLAQLAAAVGARVLDRGDHYLLKGGCAE